MQNKKDLSYYPAPEMHGGKAAFLSNGHLFESLSIVVWGTAGKSSAGEVARTSDLKPNCKSTGCDNIKKLLWRE